MQLTIAIIAGIIAGSLVGYIIYLRLTIAKERAAGAMKNTKKLEKTPVRPDDLGGKNTIAEPDNTIALEDMPNPYLINPHTQVQFTS
jgi:hypothetical protein